ncbi:MAG: hypothetical protein A3J37_08915 [Alphaproteobacteria bacterium RIFCSPHIGHO2_12_FULL_45_9]|nr:MAG: hypothetical protein A3B66_01815 [Alphaproteobacteria bacterium RIFCSPHIGHO2_02_FULL_46_13]OFW98646.1 MAG: hypothetical protein A3J37_08915 [Alphaproteobacteria bacterium RIFCSPHIGHO2_12_FULL_45_9]
MSDEFEDISVAETEPMEIASVEPAMTSAVAEALPAEVEATQINLDPADEALKNNSQQAYTETYAPDRLNEGATPITASAIAAREEEKEAKRNEAFEHHQAQLKQVEARNEFLNKDHDFGGMKMSGADLEKLMNFISNPQMQDKLRERLGKSGMPKEKIDKGMKELNEYIELKKKEQEGKLSEEDQRRLREINKSEEFKATSQALAEQAKDYGIELSGNKNEAAIAAVNTQDQSISVAARIDKIKTNNNNLASSVASNEKGFEGYDRSQSAYDHFSSAPHLADEFASKVAVSKPASAANDFSTGLNSTTPTAVVAQVKPKAIDVSFG